MSENDPGIPIVDVVPSGTAQPRRSVHRPRAGIGGTYSHSPMCKCRPCSARRREPETLAVAAGVGGLHLAPESAPTKAVTTKDGLKKAAPRSLRDRVAQYIHYASLYPNETLAGLADKMGITRKQLYSIMRQGREAEILTFDDPLDKIEHEIIPKVVENLSYFLDQKDKTVTIEAAKGTIFRTYQDSKGISDGGQTILALKIEQADGSEIKVMSGHIVGTPKETPVIVKDITDAVE